MARAIYTLFSILVIGGYGFIGWRGVEIRPSHRQYAPHGLRSAPHGGYRSFWTSGFHGGK